MPIIAGMNRPRRRPAVDSIHPESAKFTAPLLFVHGLWGSPQRWRRPMGFFAHRGWQCHALHLPHWHEQRGADPHECSAAAVATLALAAEQLDAPLVVIGHDAGALLALAAHEFVPRAIVAIAPLLPRHASRGSLTPGRDLGQRWAALRGRPLPPPRDRVAWFGAGAAEPDRCEASAWVQALAAIELAPPAVPCLFVVPESDRVSLPDEQAALAQDLGADTLRLAGGHALPYAEGWERCVAAVHRWLVHRLGAPLLAWIDEMERGEL